MNRPNMIYLVPMLSGGSVILHREINFDSATANGNISNNLGILVTMTDTTTKQFLSENSVKNTSIKETQGHSTDTESKTRSDYLEIIDTTVESGEISGGKDTTNTTCTYKKRSKYDASSCKSLSKKTPVKDSKVSFDQERTREEKFLQSQSPKNNTKISSSVKRKRSHSSNEDGDTGQLKKVCIKTSPSSKLSDNRSESSCKSLSKETPVIYSEETFSQEFTSEQKCLNSKSPKEKITRISPSVNLKEPGSSKNDGDTRQLEEVCDRTSPTSKLSGNRSEGSNLKITKNLKFEDIEKLKKNSLYLISKPFWAYYKIPKLISEPKRDKSFKAQLNLPKPSSRSDLVITIITSKISSTGGGEDLLLKKEIKPFPTSISENVPLKDRGEVSLSNAGGYVSLVNRGEVSLANVGRYVPLMDRGEVSLANVGGYVPLSEIEPSITIKGEVPLRVIQELYLTVVSKRKPISEREGSLSASVSRCATFNEIQPSLASVSRCESLSEILPSLTSVNRCVPLSEIEPSIECIEEVPFSWIEELYLRVVREDVPLNVKENNQPL